MLYQNRLDHIRSKSTNEECMNKIRKLDSLEGGSSGGVGCVTGIALSICDDIVGGLVKGEVAEQLSDIPVVILGGPGGEREEEGQVVHGHLGVLSA